VSSKYEGSEISGAAVALFYVHMILKTGIVARMAYDILEKENPVALKKAEEILANMANQTITSSERDHPFVEAAPFADMVKYKGGGW